MIRGVSRVLVGFAVVSLAASSACQAPEAFHKDADGGAEPGTTGGSFAATGGVLGSGGAETGGVPGTGGETGGGGNNGGETGTGGSATGGASTGGAATGGANIGGAGGAGGAGIGGRGGGGAPTGGAGVGGLGGANIGGGGATGIGGRGGGGAPTGGAGVGGNTGAGPCMGLCTGALSVAMGTNSGPLGTASTCHEVVGNLSGIVCGNFAPPRTLSVNGSPIACGGGNVTVPAKRNGGYCVQTTAGNYSFAYFAPY
jgi:hypothetical protein